MPHHHRPADRGRRERASETPVRVNALYGANHRLPMVMLTVGDAKPLHFQTDEARRVARLLVEAAEAAEQDGFIVEYFTDEMELSEGQVMTLLANFRDHRLKWMDDEL